MTLTTRVKDDEVVGPSDRSFGLVFTGVFLVAGLWPLGSGGEPRWWALAVSGTVLGLALVWPRGLALPNRGWLRLGLAMHRVVNPVVMALVFYGAVTPFAFIARLFQPRLVRRLRPDPALPTYWIARDTRDEAVSRMDQQF